MAWEKFNQWLTLIANLAVVAGILVLAAEIRQNTYIAEAAAREGVAAHDFLFLSSVLDSSILASANAKLESGDEELSPVEKSQLFHRQHLNFRVFEHSFYQYQKGLLDRTEWERHERIARDRLANDEYARQVWQQFESSFSPEFVRVLAEHRDDR